MDKVLMTRANSIKLVIEILSEANLSYELTGEGRATKIFIKKDGVVSYNPALKEHTTGVGKCNITFVDVVRVCAAGNGSKASTFKAELEAILPPAVRIAEAEAENNAIAEERAKHAQTIPQSNDYFFGAADEESF